MNNKQNLENIPRLSRHIQTNLKKKKKKKLILVWQVVISILK